MRSAAINKPSCTLYLVRNISCGFNAVITIATRLRYDYDPTTTYRARLLPIRRKQKMNTSIFHRSRVVVESQLWYRLNFEQSESVPCHISNCAIWIDAKASLWRRIRVCSWVLFVGKVDVGKPEFVHMLVRYVFGHICLRRIKTLPLISPRLPKVDINTELLLNTHTSFVSKNIL